MVKQPKIIYVEKEIKFSKKQMEAWNYLHDTSSAIILYGGKSNSGKSMLSMYWLIDCCLTMPNTRWALCRKTLKSLRGATLQTFKETGKKFFNIEDGIHYKVNNASNIITFYNSKTKKFDGNEIYMMKLDYMPSDQEGNFLGGYEFSGAVIDELPEICHPYFSVLFTRLRFNIDHPKLFCTCNPTNNWVKSYFYDKWKKDRLETYIKFITTAGDSTFFRNESYKTTLKAFSEKERRRLEEGDWEFASASDQLFSIDKMEDIFTGHDYGLEKKDNKIVDDYYISADIARMGADSSVIILWNGLKIIKIDQLIKSKTTDTAEHIRKIMNEYKIPRNKVIVDSDGVGGGVMDMLSCKGFINNSKAYNNERYDMLKSQCYFKLAQDKWSIDEKIDEPIKDMIRTELGAIRDASDDAKYKINTKDEQKRLIGHSPDFSDAIMMRMYFLLDSFKVEIEIW